MRARGLLIMAGLLLAACQPTAEVPTAPEAGVDYSNAPEWVRRNPLDQKLQALETPPAAELLPPIVIAKAEDMPPAPEGELTVDGWGPIRIGMTLDEVNAALGVHLTVEGDPEYADYQCTYLNLPDEGGWPGVMYIDGQVVRIDVHRPGIKTYGGIQIGETAAKVREVFGSKLNERPHFYNGLPSKYLTVWTRGGPTPEGRLAPEQLAALRFARGIRFETDDNGKVTDFYAGDSAIEAVEGCQ